MTTAYRLRERGRRLVEAAGVIVLAASEAPLVANAQSSAEPTIEEIVVTARKREEFASEVPVSVAAFTSSFIEKLGLTRIEDVARYTPGFSLDTATGRQPASDRPSIRGLTTIRNGIANSNVAAAFIDGIYVGGSIQSTELYNLERVEIIRGPQAAQFGRGTFAGAINYITRRPGNEHEGELSLAAGEHGSAGLTAWLSGPVIENRLAYSVAAGHRTYDGEYVNQRDGSAVGGEETSDVTTRLYWNPNESLEISAKLGAQYTDDDHFAVYLQPRTLNNCCFRSAEAPRAREYFVGEARAVDEVHLATDLLNAAGRSGTELDRRLAAVDVRWTLPNGGTLSSLTGVIEDDVKRGFDSSYAGYDPLSFMPGTFTQIDELAQRDVSQEIRYSVFTGSAVRWTVGGYLYDGRFDEVEDDRVYRDAGGSIVVAPNFGALTQDRVKNRALFGGAEWDIGLHWTAGAELRWARDNVSVTSFANDATRAQVESFEETFTSVTPRFTLSYQATEDRNYYLSVAEGTNPGDFNADVPVLADGSPDERYRAVDEEQLRSYEIGVKGSWWRHRATGSIAAYYVDAEDQQLTQIVDLAGGASASILRNIGRTSVRGLESQFTAALSDRVAVYASYAYTDAELREHISAEEADLRGSNGSPEQTKLLGDVSGHRVPRVPEHTAALVVRFENRLARGGLWYVSGNLTYESSRFAQEHNLIETGDRSLVGFRVGLDSGRWDASLLVTNLLDDDTPLDIIRYFDRRSGQLESYPQQGPSRASSSPRGFALALPRGRQVRTTFRYRF